MNKNSWSRLPEDVKNIISELAGEYRERVALVWNASDFAGLRAAKKKGIKFIELSSKEVERWKKAVEPIIDSYIMELESKGYKRSELEAMLNFIRERTSFWTKKQITYGIKSVTGPEAMRVK